MRSSGATMTEADWLTYTDPGRMLEFLRGKASERKLRLFAVACCRHNFQCMVDVRRRKAVEVAELYADGLANEEELMAAHQCVDTAWGESEAFAVWASAVPVQVESICQVQRPTWVNHRLLLLDIFGNPFRPIAINTAWLTPTVKELAQAIYDDRAFERLPILADALEEAGCTSQDILNHCRQAGVHVRGCWVVDLLLKKE